MATTKSHHVRLEPIDQARLNKLSSWWRIKSLNGVISEAINSAYKQELQFHAKESGVKGRD